MRRPLLALLVLVVAFTLWYSQRGGVKFSLLNVGDSALDSVVVFAGGREYRFDRIAARDSVGMVVRTSGDSHFEVALGAGPMRRRVNLNGYFETGYRGSFRVRMTRDSVLEIDDQIALPY